MAPLSIQQPIMEPGKRTHPGEQEMTRSYPSGPTPQMQIHPWPAFNQAEDRGIRFAQRTKKASGLTPMVLISPPYHHGTQYF